MPQANELTFHGDPTLEGTALRNKVATFQIDASSPNTDSPSAFESFPGCGVPDRDVDTSIPDNRSVICEVEMASHDASLVGLPPQNSVIPFRGLRSAACEEGISSLSGTVASSMDEPPRRHNVTVTSGLHQRTNTLEDTLATLITGTATRGDLAGSPRPESTSSEETTASEDASRSPSSDRDTLLNFPELGSAVIKREPSLVDSATSSVDGPPLQNDSISSLQIPGPPSMDDSMASSGLGLVMCEEGITSQNVSMTSSMLGPPLQGGFITNGITSQDALANNLILGPDIPNTTPPRPDSISREGTTTSEYASVNLHIPRSPSMDSSMDRSGFGLAICEKGITSQNVSMTPTMHKPILQDAARIFPCLGSAFNKNGIIFKDVSVNSSVPELALRDGLTSSPRSESTSSKETTTPDNVSVTLQSRGSHSSDTLFTFSGHESAATSSMDGPRLPDVSMTLSSLESASSQETSEDASVASLPGVGSAAIKMEPCPDAVNLAAASVDGLSLFCAPLTSPSLESPFSNDETTPEEASMTLQPPGSPSRDALWTFPELKSIICEDTALQDALAPLLSEPPHQDNLTICHESASQDASEELQIQGPPLRNAPKTFSLQVSPTSNVGTASQDTVVTSTPATFVETSMRSPDLGSTIKKENLATIFPCRGSPPGFRGTNSLSNSVILQSPSPPLQNSSTTSQYLGSTFHESISNSQRTSATISPWFNVNDPASWFASATLPIAKPTIKVEKEPDLPTSLNAEPTFVTNKLSVSVPQEFIEVKKELCAIPSPVAATTDVFILPIRNDGISTDSYTLLEGTHQAFDSQNIDVDPGGHTKSPENSTNRNDVNAATHQVLAPTKRNTKRTFPGTEPFEEVDTQSSELSHSSSVGCVGVVQADEPVAKKARKSLLVPASICETDGQDLNAALSTPAARESCQTVGQTSQKSKPSLVAEASRARCQSYPSAATDVHNSEISGVSLDLTNSTTIEGIVAPPLERSYYHRMFAISQRTLAITNSDRMENVHVDDNVISCGDYLFEQFNEEYDKEYAENNAHSWASDILA